jgi:hypothetical protein
LDVTDEHGEAFFAGLGSGSGYQVRLASTPTSDVSQSNSWRYGTGMFRVRPVDVQPSVKQPDLKLSEGAPLPRTEELRAEPAILEETFTAQADKEFKVLMRAVPMRYIYGTIRGPSGSSKEQWKLLPIERALNRSGASHIRGALRGNLSRVLSRQERSTSILGTAYSDFMLLCA